MGKSSILSTITHNYISEHYESSKMINYNELTEKDGAFSVLYKDLSKTEINGYPFASDYVSSSGTTYSVNEFKHLPEEIKKTCDLRYYYLPYSHELYIGTTGSGKTTGCIEPQLRAISSQKNKPNLFLTDPKGELFNRNARHLKNQGYEIFVLNFKDPMRSDKWNPLLDLYDTKILIKNLGQDCKMHIGVVKDTLKLIAPKDKYSQEGYIEYDGYAFPNSETYENYLQFQIDFLNAKIDDHLNQLASMMVEINSKTDKSWELGAQELLKGIILCMLEEAISDNGFTRDMMNFRTLQQYYIDIKTPILANNNCTLANHWLTKDKPENIRALLSTALGNAPNTMRSYCGVFDGAMQNWFNGHIFSLTSTNTININNTDNKPFAIFLITRDYEKSDFLIAGLFIDWIYKKMLEHAEKNKSNRPLHFLLDEFGNIPKLNSFENKISTARSRNIWFHLVVQSYKQIDLVYGEETSIIVRDNCNSQIFLGAQNFHTKEIFSQECGKHAISTLESKLNPTTNSIIEVPLVPLSKLDQITPGNMYIKRLYMPIITTQFVRSYICAENGDFKNFIDENGLYDCTPALAFEPFTSEKYTYKKLYDNKIVFNNFDW